MVSPGDFDPDGFSLESWAEWSARRRVWREGLARYNGGVPMFLDVPAWHAEEALGVRSFGWFSDHAWAVTVRPNPRYL